MNPSSVSYTTSFPIFFLSTLEHKLTVVIAGNKNKKPSGSKAGDIQAAPIVDKDELRDIRKKTEKGQKSDAIVISKGELERMKASTKIQTKEQESQHRRLLEEQKDQQMAEAKARKQRMLEMDKERSNKLPPTEYQQLTKDKNETLLTKAQMMLDEEHDDVKHMNQMMLYSKVVTIRDK